MADAATLVVIGGGNMAQAVVRGAIDAGAIVAREIVVAEPDPVKRGLLEGWGVRAVDAAAEIDPAGLAADAQVMLAVKPQMLGAAVEGARPGVFGERVVITMLAGATSTAVRRATGGRTRVVRVMPNTPARIGKGITALAIGEGAADGDGALALRLFGAVGEVVRIEEGLMDAFTAVAGSGPAYVFYLAEGMRRGAEEAGFDARTADRIVRATVEGAAGLLSASPEESAEALRAAVTSKGGTTAAAVGVLDEGRMMEVVVRAVVAARDRGKELGGG